MHLFRTVFSLLLILIQYEFILCWTDDDLQLFDLVENTDRKFYDILGVDQKASASDIRKAYRKLSQQYHPDRNKEPDAEETFRKIAAISEVLRNEELRKKYDIILQTGLPDWREPIYYYRRVRNMGLFELIIFLFCLATLGQYLFVWSVYWERKYEIEEVFSSRLKRKAKHQRKGKKCVEDVEPSCDDICNLPKPKCQDLFPVQLVYFLIHIIKSSPSFLMSCLQSLKSIKQTTAKKDEQEDEEEEETHSVKREVRPKMKKHVEPLYPELNDADTEEFGNLDSSATNGNIPANSNDISKKINFSELSEASLNEFKKALKKFPSGTLQRWEKIGDYLNCSVSEVIKMAKHLKCLQPKQVPISAQGLTGCGDFQHIDGAALDGKLDHNNAKTKSLNDAPELVDKSQGAIHQRIVKKNDKNTNDSSNLPENIWKQEEQRLLEMALQKFSKDKPNRWDHIAEFVNTKTKDECVARYKWLAQEIKRKRDKEN